MWSGFLLQLWLRWCQTSGLLLCGRAGTFWVGISGTMFRISLGGWLCRLRLLWGEFFLFLPFGTFCGSGFFIFLSLLAVVVYLVMVWFWALSWRVLFSSDRDDSFIKLHEAFSVLFAARLRIVRMLVCLSWNGNYNGFDLIGLVFLMLSFEV